MPNQRQPFPETETEDEQAAREQLEKLRGQGLTKEGMRTALANFGHLLLDAAVLLFQLDDGWALRHTLCTKGALIDHLTNAYSRRALETVLGRLQEQGQAYSILFVDVDNFRSFNNMYGHKAGDLVLQAVMVRIRRVMRNHDIAGRWGGEEFIVIVPDTAETPAMDIAERVRLEIATKPIEIVDNAGERRYCTVTASIGVAEAALGDTWESVVRRADRAMYRAKDMGKDCVCGDREDFLTPDTTKKKFVRKILFVLHLIQIPLMYAERRLRTALHH